MLNNITAIRQLILGFFLHSAVSLQHWPDRLPSQRKFTIPKTTKKVQDHHTIQTRRHDGPRVLALLTEYTPQYV